jgi:hypothetical protein
MSTIYVTVDELIVFAIAVSIALVPLIIWRGRRTPEIRLEAVSTEKSFGAADTARTTAGRQVPDTARQPGEADYPRAAAISDSSASGAFQREPQ